MSDETNEMTEEVEYLKEGIYDIVWDGIDHKDYPDFVDANIESAYIDGRPMDWNELDMLNNDSEYIHEMLMLHLY